MTTLKTLVDGMNLIGGCGCEHLDLDGTTDVEQAQ